MNQKERMLAGLPYKAWMDGLPEESMENALKTYRYNSLPPNDTAGSRKAYQRNSWESRKEYYYKTALLL